MCGPLAVLLEGAPFHEEGGVAGPGLGFHGAEMSVFISEPFSSQPHPETAGNGEDDE